MKVEDHISWAQGIISNFRNERNIPIDHEDAISLGMVGLMKAVRDYKEDKGEFRKFAWARVIGELRDWVRISVRRKNLAEMVSLETIPLWEPPSMNGTAKKVINKDLVEWILDSVEFDQAYALERYYLDGLYMTEIGVEMGVTESRVSQIITDGLEKAKRIWTRRI